MGNTENDNVKLCYYNHLPNVKIKWKLAPISKTKYQRYKKEFHITKKNVLSKTKFYNRNNKNKIYYMRMYLFFSRHTGFETLYIEGNLSDWYYQVSLGRNLSSEEYEDCMNYLLSEIKVPRMDAEDIEEALHSFEYEQTLDCITKHKEFQDKKRHKRISKIKLTQITNL